MAYRILIVEDEETLKESLLRVLSREGYEVASADCSETALETIKGTSFDLIITDIVLPGCSGLELLKLCRRQNPEIRVIIITAYATIESAVEAIRAGAYEYLVKPIVHEELIAVVRKALGGTEPKKTSQR
jgi:DNA-binding NtrC family response regulator